MNPPKGIFFFKILLCLIYFIKKFIVYNHLIYFVINKFRDTICFTTIDMTFYDWCIIKVVSVVDPNKSDVALISIGHVNNCEKYYITNITL
jgi:hypothetical protein